MPALVIYQAQTDSILERQKIFTRNKERIAQSAFNKMVDYNPIGNGTLGITFEWPCPDGGAFIYSNSNSELFFDGTPYSSLGEAEKAKFHKWLPQFSKQFVIRYNKEYNI